MSVMQKPTQEDMIKTKGAKLMDKTFIQQLEDVVSDIKDDFDEGVNDSKTLSYARGAADALNRLVRHFKEIEDGE